jgi:hypothetical protein
MRVLHFDPVHVLLPAPIHTEVDLFIFPHPLISLLYPSHCRSPPQLPAPLHSSTSRASRRSTSPALLSFLYRRAIPELGRPIHGRHARARRWDEPASSRPLYGAMEGLIRMQNWFYFRLLFVWIQIRWMWMLLWNFDFWFGFFLWICVNPRPVSLVHVPRSENYFPGFVPVEICNRWTRRQWDFLVLMFREHCNLHIQIALRKPIGTGLLDIDVLEGAFCNYHRRLHRSQTKCGRSG